MEIKVTKNNFENEVINSTIPVLVDFWATWCYPCRMLGAELESIASEYDGKLKVAKVNVDEEEELAIKFRVSSIPMVVLYNKGEIVTTFIGYRPKDEIIKEIAGLINL